GQGRHRNTNLLGIILFRIQGDTDSNFRRKLTPQAIAAFKLFMVKVNQPDHFIGQIGFAYKWSGADYPDFLPDIGYGRGQPAHGENGRVFTPAPPAPVTPGQLY